MELCRMVESLLVGRWRIFHLEDPACRQTRQDQGMELMKEEASNRLSG